VHTATVSLMGKPRQIAHSLGEAIDLPEIVLIPGLGIRGYLRPLVRLLATWTRITMLDLPGWSVAHRQFCRARVPDIGAAAARWLEANDRADVILMGHSTGAQAALHAAVTVPDRLSGLILAGPVFPPEVRRPGSLARAVLRTLPYESWAELPAVLPASLASGLVALARLLGSGMRSQPEDLVPEVATMPVCVITGRRDGVAPPDWARQLADAANGTVEIHPGGHNACFVDPASVEAAVRRAVEQCMWQHNRLRPSP
jgi:pimeloyl-ACP methyl ester carboxylesterase